MSEKKQCPRLIEVALPIREVSFESARDKSIRHGHISTLHLWWARRPLPACRAIVFASLVPDPDHPDCPSAFKEKVGELLGKDLYKPYSNIPHTAEEDPMPDTLRNRLLMFVGKFSDEYCRHENEGAKAPSPSDALSAGSLVKWESSVDTDGVLKIARELILVANDGKPPKVLDPFSGGGAIPLEAARLGCDSYANELNPVAHIVELCSLVYPQKYGKQVEMPKKEYEKIYGQTETSQSSIDDTVVIPNKLAHDVDYWAQWVLKKVEEEIGHCYPDDELGKKTVAFLWVRTVQCSNPSCTATIPLFSSFWLCKTPTKSIALKPIYDKKTKVISYKIVAGKDIDFDPEVGLSDRGNATCPFCESVTSAREIRNAGKKNAIGDKMVAVIIDGNSGKEYRIATKADLQAFDKTAIEKVEIPQEAILPEITANLDAVKRQNSTGIRVHLYGMTTWGSLFNHRQLLMLNTFSRIINSAFTHLKEQHDEEYSKAVIAYLGLWLDRIALASTAVGRWHTGRETIEHPFSRQAIPMIWDYPEVNPFSKKTGSASNHLEWIRQYLIRENHFYPCEVLLGSATHISQIQSNSLHAVVTDPPYYDAIGYADLSDFFYVWLKRSLGKFFPEVFKTPLTPKKEEVTSLKHRHDSEEKSKFHFESLLTESFREARRMIKDDGVVSIMFAHQSTEAWTAFVKAILDAELNITASWPIDTEMKNKIGAVSDQKSAFLSSSVTVVCRKRNKGSIASFKEVRRELEKVVEDSISRFWQLGFRGADLIVSTFGPAVGVFGMYERVEKADGTLVSVADLLLLVRELAFRQIVGGLQTDELSRAYIGWLNLYGLGEEEWDDAQKTIQMGTDINIQDAVLQKIFIKDGNKVRIADLSDRSTMPKLGESKKALMIDKLHRAMLFWKKEDREALVHYLANINGDSEEFWKLAQALFEILPNGHPDWKIVQALLSDKSALVTAAKHSAKSDSQPKQDSLF